jgi:TrmH family RNA methyltransferase
MSEMITSPQNDHVKHLAALQKDGELRNEHRHFLVEGPRFAETALNGSAHVEELIYSPNLAGEDHPIEKLARSKGVKVTLMSKDCYKKIADVKSPQGLAALVAFPEHKLDEVVASCQLPVASSSEEPGTRNQEPGTGLFLVACGIQDPGNLGTMIRTADAAGAAAVLVIRPAADIYNSKVVRSTAGSILNLPVISGIEEEILAALRKAKVRLVLAEAREGADCRKADWSRPVAIAVGAEAAGFTPAVRAAAAGTVNIPMWGKAESLNAATAAALCLYAARWDEKEVGR